MDVEQADVLVVGAGPVGLAAAGDLAEAGHRVVVLDRWPRVNPASRAFAVAARTLELLDARGVADELLARGRRADRVELFHRAGLRFDRVASRYPFALVVPQHEVDSALLRRAVACGAVLRRGLEVVQLEQDADGVTVGAVARDAADGAPATRLHAPWLIAADGAHSTVRSLLGVGFPGRTVLSGMALADVTLARPPRTGVLAVGSGRDAFSFLAPYGTRDAAGEHYRLMTWHRGTDPDETVPVEITELRAALLATQGDDFGLASVGWRSRFHSDERQVAQYRHGQVLLAGDAAHVHSPVGGQGMNTGIQDAIGLAWKLSAVLTGADAALLDSYQAERHPVGVGVVRLSGRMLRMMLLRSRVLAGVRDLLLPGLLALPPVQRAVAARMAGTSVRYRRSRGEHPLVGRRAEQIPLVGTTLATLQRPPQFVLLTAGAPVVDLPLRHAVRADGGPAVLVRPDGYIAWAGTGDGWRTVWSRWAGTSVVTPADR